MFQGGCIQGTCAICATSTVIYSILKDLLKLQCSGSTQQRAQTLSYSESNITSFLGKVQENRPRVFPSLSNTGPQDKTVAARQHSYATEQLVRVISGVSYQKDTSGGGLVPHLEQHTTEPPNHLSFHSWACKRALTGHTQMSCGCSSNLLLPSCLVHFSTSLSFMAVTPSYLLGRKTPSLVSVHFSRLNVLLEGDHRLISRVTVVIKVSAHRQH